MILLSGAKSSEATTPPKPQLFFLEGFPSTLSLDSLTVVCLSVYFTLHSIQISGLVQTSHGCPERKVAW